MDSDYSRTEKSSRKITRDVCVIVYFLFIKHVLNKCCLIVKVVIVAPHGFHSGTLVSVSAFNDLHAMIVLDCMI